MATAYKETEIPSDVSTTPHSECHAPLLSQYDPYHQTTFTVHHPFTKKPLEIGQEVDASFHLYGASLPNWKLNYQDFSPDLEGLDANTIRCTTCFQYRELLDRANAWLRQNPSVSVKTCETLCWWTTEAIHVGDTEAVVFTQSTFPHQEEDTIYLGGLRLWLVPKKNDDHDHEVQQIQYRDFKPLDKESLTHLVKRVNRRLEDQPLPGKILTTETIFCPQISARDSEGLLWRETQCQRGEYTIFLRIFYIEGAPQPAAIGIKDFCPDIVAGSHEPFGALVKKASRWINDEKEISVTNLKSLYMSRENDCPVDCADRCTHHSFSFSSQQYFQILRVFFVRRMVAEQSNYCMLNYVTFTPVQLLPGPAPSVDYERMKQSIIRVMAWLRAAGAEVFCAESVTTPMVPNLTSQSLPEVTYWTPSVTFQETNIRKCLMHIRVYLEGEYKEPDPRVLPPLPYSLTIGLQVELIRREQGRRYLKKQKTKRRKSIMIIACVIILVLALGLILLDQAFHFFGL